MPEPARDEIFRLACPTCGHVSLVGSLEGLWGCARCRGPAQVIPVDDPQIVRAWETVWESFGDVEVVETASGFVFSYRELRRPFEAVRTRFDALGFLPFLRRMGRQCLCRIVARPARTPMLLPRHMILFAMTLATTIWVGYESGNRMVAEGLATSPLMVALSYSAALFAILGGHEMGHFVVARFTGTEASLPYFVPGPPPLGTFGAMISLRTPAPNRDSAVLLGAAGPFVGFLLSVPALWYGLRHSNLVAMDPLVDHRGVYLVWLPPLCRWLASGAAPSTVRMDSLHPVAFAGWIGLLATCLNLMPMGQLDGGHIARALLGPRWHRHFSYLVVWALFVLGMGLGARQGTAGLIFWAFLGLLITLAGHPGALDEVRPMRWWSWLVAAVALAVLVLSATPPPG